MKENISPEERLLRLVKQGAKKSTPPPTSTSSTLSPKTKKPIFTPRIFKRFFSIRYLNNLLLLLLFLSLINLTLNLIMLPKITEVETLSLLSKQEEKDTDEDLMSQMKSYSYYAQQIGKRTLFVPSIGKREKDSSEAKLLSLRKIMQDFTLIGIMKRENPQAIIEDKKAKKTYFLKRGDYLDEGEIKIRDIQEGKVILEYRGESFDLFL